MADFVISIKDSMQTNWNCFGELAISELFQKAGTVDKSRYQAIRGVLKEQVARAPDVVILHLNKIAAMDFDLEAVNSELYFVFFEQLCEAIIHFPDYHGESRYGDRVPMPHLFEHLKSVLDREVGKRGNHGGVLFWRGILNHLSGNSKTASELLLQASVYDRYGFSLPHYLGGSRNTIVNIDSLSGFSKLLKLEPELDFIQEQSDGSEELVLLSCANSLYINRLSEQFLSSIDALGRKICVHIHLIKDGTVDPAIVLDRKFDNITLDISQSELGTITDRSWFTVVRWLILPSALKHYDKLLVVSDFDVEYEPDNFDAYVEQVRKYDVGVNINGFPQNRFPWTTINANLLACNSTEAAEKFAQSLRDTTQIVFDTRKSDQWWIDQNILFTCFFEFRNARMSPRIFNNLNLPIKNTIRNKKDILAGKPVAKKPKTSAPKPTAHNEKKVFSDIYKDHAWAGGDETRSGSGSTLQSTQLTVPRLIKLIDDLKIKHLLDIGCGDGHWMLKVIPHLARYEGADIVDDLIGSNRERAKSLGINHASYCVLNPILDVPNKADAILFRDVAIHLPNETVMKCFSNFVRSGSKYLITTNFADEPEDSKFFKRLNGDVRIGGYRRISYDKAPFLLPPPLARIKDSVVLEGDVESSLHNNREMVVYDLAQIAPQVESWEAN